MPRKIIFYVAVALASYWLIAPSSASAKVPEFIFKLLSPPQSQITQGPGILESLTRFVDRYIYGMCPVAPEPQHCDIDGAVNPDGLTYRLNWICLGYPDGCDITKNDQ